MPPWSLPSLQAPTLLAARLPRGPPTPRWCPSGTLPSCAAAALLLSVGLPPSLVPVRPSGPPVPGLGMPAALWLVPLPSLLFHGVATDGTVLAGGRGGRRPVMRVLEPTGQPRLSLQPSRPPCPGALLPLLQDLGGSRDCMVARRARTARCSGGLSALSVSSKAEKGERCCQACVDMRKSASVRL